MNDLIFFGLGWASGLIGAILGWVFVWRCKR